MNPWTVVCWMLVAFKQFDYIKKNHLKMANWLQWWTKPFFCNYSSVFLGRISFSCDEKIWICIFWVPVMMRGCVCVFNVNSWHRYNIITNTKWIHCVLCRFFLDRDIHTFINFSIVFVASFHPFFIQSRRFDFCQHSVFKFNGIRAILPRRMSNVWKRAIRSSCIEWTKSQNDRDEKPINKIFLKTS